MRQRNLPPSESRPNHSPEELEEILRACGIHFASQQVRQLWTYHKLLRQYNPELNLTRLHSFSSMVLKLYADSLLPGRLMKLPTPLLDLGTGPGMPGIPLKIAHPELEILLAESRRKRVEFLEKVVEEMQLSGVRVIGRGINERFEDPVEGVVTRAVGTMEATIGRVHGCLSHGGLVIFMKGLDCDAEIRDAVRSFGSEYALVKDLKYRIGNTPHRRRLVVFERRSDPPRVMKADAMKRHAVRRIESEQNDLFRDLKRLLVPRGIKKLHGALVSGPKQIREALENHPEMAVAWISCAETDPPPLDAPSDLNWYQLAPSLFEVLDVFGTSHPLLLVKTPEIPRWDPLDGLPEGCTVFVPFQDPENVGAVMRSAVAFGVSQVILLEGSAHPFHPKAVRASGGAVFRAKLLHGPRLGDLPEDAPILALSPEGVDISTVDFPKSFGLLPGLEGPGLPDQWRSTAVSIPIRREVESLNAATATAIALYVWSHSMKRR